jgi:hypothetical protein
LPRFFNFEIFCHKSQLQKSFSVIPAKAGPPAPPEADRAGIQSASGGFKDFWTPAFAGVTVLLSFARASFNIKILQICVNLCPIDTNVFQGKGE